MTELTKYEHPSSHVLDSSITRLPFFQKIRSANIYEDPNSFFEPILDYEIELSNHVVSEEIRLDEEIRNLQNIQFTKEHVQRPDDLQAMLIGIGAWLFVTVISWSISIWYGLLSLIIIGPIVGITINSIISGRKYNELVKKNDAEHKFRVQSNANDIQDAYSQKYKLKPDQQKKLKILHDLQTTAENHLTARQTEVNEAIENFIARIKVEVEIDINPESPASKGKPTITWTGLNISDHINTMPNEYEVEAGIFYNDEDLIRDNIYSFSNLLKLIDINSTNGEYFDQSLKENETRCYYFLIVIKGKFLEKFSKFVWVAKDSNREWNFLAERATSLPYITNAQKLDEEMQEHATSVKRAKFEKQLEATMAKMSGTAGDPDAALRDTLEESKSRREREKKKQEYVAQIESDLAEVGHSEEEIEEAIEDFYKRMEK